MAMQDDNLIDKVVFYVGVFLAILGIAFAGVAVVRSMLFK